MHALPLDLRAPHIVISTISGERHELGAILAAASAAAEGWRVTYLGPDLPVAEIAQVVLATRANAVGVSVIYSDDDRAVLAALRELRGLLPSAVSIFVGGEAGADLARELDSHGVSVVRNLSDFRTSLEAKAPRHAA
jgi:methylmalonyl-CoA mutase cobalamin-binding subunit